MNKKLAAVRQAAMTPESSSTDIKGFDQASRIHENTQFVLATTRGQHFIIDYYRREATPVIQ